MNKQYYTVKETSKILGLTEQTIRDYLSSERLKGEKIFNSTVISKKEVERYMREREERKEFKYGRCKMD